MISHVFKRYEVLGIAGFCLLLATAANAAPPAKIDVCHVPPDTPENIQRILVSAKGGALDDHLSHGDWLVSEEMCDAIADNDCDGIPGTPVQDEASCDDSNPDTTVDACVATSCLNCDVTSPSKACAIASPTLHDCQGTCGIIQSTLVGAEVAGTFPLTVTTRKTVGDGFIGTVNLVIRDGMGTIIDDQMFVNLTDDSPNASEFFFKCDPEIAANLEFDVTFCFGFCDSNGPASPGSRIIETTQRAHNCPAPV